LASADIGCSDHSRKRSERRPRNLHHQTAPSPTERDAVTIGGATPTGSPYNGTFAVESALSATQFTYRMNDDPGAHSQGGPYSYAALWQEGHLFVEKTVMDLIAYPGNNIVPGGILILDRRPTLHGDQFLILDCVARGNVIGNTADPSAYPNGIGFDSVRNAIVEANIVQS